MKLAKRTFRIARKDYKALTVAALLNVMGIMPDTEDPQFILHDARKVWRAAAAKVHPDRGGNAEECVRLNAAMAALEEKLCDRRTPVRLPKKLPTPMRKPVTKEMVMVRSRKYTTIRDVARKSGMSISGVREARLRFGLGGLKRKNRNCYRHRQRLGLA